MEEENVKKNSGYSIAALVLGIVAVVFGLVWYISIPCAIIAIVFGVKEKKKDKNNKFAKAGFILGIISIVLTILLIAISVLISVSLNDGLFEAAREASERTRENEELSRKSAEQIEEIQKSLFDDFDIDYDY